MRSQQAKPICMGKNICKSIGAVLAGFVLIAFLAFVTDTVLQRVGILPVTGAKRFEYWDSLLALSYHLAYTLLGGYVAARLAPHHPMAHALALGALEVVFSAAGLIAITTGDLAPAWYGWALIVCALPVSWMGGKLFILQQKAH